MSKKKYLLCDFGSATREPAFPVKKTRAAISSELERCTTFIYRAPEMVDLYMDRWIDEKCDIWVRVFLLNIFLDSHCGRHWAACCTRWSSW